METLNCDDSRDARACWQGPAASTSYEVNLTLYRIEALTIWNGVTLEAVSAGRPVPIGIEEGFHALAISLAALESAQSGRVCRPERLWEVYFKGIPDLLHVGADYNASLYGDDFGLVPC